MSRHYTVCHKEGVVGVWFTNEPLKIPDGWTFCSNAMYADDLTREQKLWVLTHVKGSYGNAWEMPNDD